MLLFRFDCISVFNKRSASLDDSRVSDFVDQIQLQSIKKTIHNESVSEMIAANTPGIPLDIHCIRWHVMAVNIVYYTAFNSFSKLLRVRVNAAMIKTYNKFKHICSNSCDGSHSRLML